jgi:tripartite-type tricarboxylate transporter receptor subunit TctC
MPAQAQQAGDFYRGKNIDLHIGYTVGGGYDIYARLLARHMGRHLPGNPTIVPRNMPGAGSLRLANWLYHAAPKDGTAFGTIGRGIAFDPLIGGKGAEFDATRFGWIGSANDEVSVCTAWGATGISKFEELYTREMIVGGTGATADTDLFPKVVNAVLGTKMRVVSGYPGGADITLAMQRGEVQGRCGWSWSSIKSTRSNWLNDGTIHVFLQLALKPHPDIPEVPMLLDLAENAEERQMIELVLARGALGRPFLAPPGVPADRAAALRRAFDDMVKDPAFLAEAERMRLEITPIGGEELQQILVRMSATPADIAAKVRAILQGGL